MRQDVPCIMCQQLVREVNSHDSPLSLSPSLVVSRCLFLSPRPITPQVYQQLALKRPGRELGFLPMFWQTPVNASSVSLLCVRAAVWAGPLAFSVVTSKSKHNCTTHAFPIVRSRLKHLSNWWTDCWETLSKYSWTPDLAAFYSGQMHATHSHTHTLQQF